MAVWNIDVAAASSTIKATAAQIEGVQPSLEGMGKALQEAAAALPGDAAVVLAALNDVVVLGLTPPATEVVSRSENVITSTAQALNFYQQGDLTMATAAQRSAGQVDQHAAAAPHGGPAKILRD
ncbi:DUF6507 family protein [Paenarthrobacter nitroguajacolicus]|uniref:DUF6507 family protein n=1 Tax=Paenarthrobacter nitroguajacolicus TaxID=211146 RepID=UPI003AE7CE62